MNNQPQEYAGYSAVVEPLTRSFLDALAAQGGPTVHEIPVEKARNLLIAVQSIGVAKTPADIEDRIIPVGPKGEVAIRIVRPCQCTEMLPAIMYFHGGGWVLADKNTHDRLIREIAVGARAALVFVEYSRSPEDRYPVAIEEAYAAAKWVAQNGAGIGINPSRIAVAGDSAGGNMAAVVTMLAKKRGGPNIGFQLMFYPSMDVDFDTPSYREFESGYFLTREAMKWFWDQYAPDVAVRDQPTACPLKASLDKLQGLPPALVITGECDVLRDEAEAYARKLVRAGVPVTATRYLGAIHGFVSLNAITQTPAARAAIAQASEALRKALWDGTGDEQT